MNTELSCIIVVSIMFLTAVGTAICYKVSEN